MHVPSFGLRRRETLIAACLAALVGICALGVRTFAQGDAPDTSAPAASQDAGERAQDALKKKRHRAAHKAPAKPTETTQGATSGPGAAGPAQQTADAGTASDAEKTGKPANAFDFAAQLDRAGASACHSQINALATSTMGKVERFNTVSNWSQTAGDKRPVSLAIGQRYPSGSAVPFSLSQVISAPNQQGSCDGFTVQVLPSPLSCAKLRDALAAQHGQQIADLAGIPLMQDTAAGQTMLVPTGTNTCVLVATRSFYAK